MEATKNKITRMVKDDGTLSSVESYPILPDDFKPGDVLKFSEGIYRVDESRKLSVIGDWLDLFALIERGEVFPVA